MAFQPIDLSALGPPIRILATPSEVPIAYAELTSVYEHAQFGRFFVAQHLTDGAATQSEFVQLSSHSPGCLLVAPTDDVFEGLTGATATVCYGGVHYFTTTPRGTSVFIHHGEVTTAAHVLIPVDLRVPEVRDTFKDPMIEIVLMGPAAEFTEEEAIEAAVLVVG